MKNLFTTLTAEIKSSVTIHDYTYMHLHTHAHHFSSHFPVKPSLASCCSWFI